MLNIIIDRRIWAAIGGAAILAASALPALGAVEQGVTATVTPQIIAIDVTDGTVDYKTVPFGGANDTSSGTADEEQTISRSASNVNIDIDLKSSDAADVPTPGAGDWNLVACASTASNAFGHQYDINAVTGSEVWSDFPDTNNYSATVATLTNSNTTDTLDLKICMPTTGDPSEHNITITARATAP